MTLVDTSAWIEFLRATGSTAHLEVHRLLGDVVPLHTTEVVVMELLAGARDERQRGHLKGLLGRCLHVPIGGLACYEIAADLHRRCRRDGDAPLSLTGCLIAAVALRENLVVLHHDRAYDLLARHSGLRTRRGR